MRSITRNSIRLLIAGLLLISVSLDLYSQQDIYYYCDDFIALKNNPAYTGDESLSDLILLTRQQWVGFKGAPKSYLLASHFKLTNKNAAVGIELSSLNIGPAKETGFYFHYSYKIPVTVRSDLTMGLKGGLDIYNVNLTDLILIDPFDPLFELDVNRKLLPNFGFGLHYNAPGYYIDFSIPGIMRNHLNAAGSDNSGKEDKQDRLYIIGGGAKYDISSDITLTPAVTTWLVKGSPVLINMKLSAAYRELVGGGIGFRPGSSLGGNFWFKFSRDIKLGYAYGLPVTSFRGSQSGSHEIMFGYDFSFIKRKTLSPRKF